MNNNIVNNIVNNMVIECIDVSKIFIDKAAGSQLQVLDKINLQIKRGSKVAIMGKSGSGKTTLLQLLGGLDIPTKGQIKINNQDIQTLSSDARGVLRNKSLGFIYQLHHLLPEFSAIENVAMPLLIRNISPAIAREKSKLLLKAVDLENRMNHKPYQLSGGERQRVAIARALVTDPDCVLADEPTGNLDSENVELMFNFIKNLNKQFGATFVIVTHDKDLASRMDHTYYLSHGCLKIE